MARRVKVGLVGCGGMARAHAKGMLSIPNVELAALAEPREDNLARMKEITGDLPSWSDYRQLAREADVDAVAIILPTAMHAEATTYCLKHGKHVICEKPPTVVSREMVRIEKLVRETGLTYMFVRQQRFEPGKLEARRQVARGRIGRPYHAETNWLRTRFIPFRGGWGVNKDAGGGVLLDLGVHSLDDAWFVMGCPKPVSAFAGMHCAFSRLAPKKLNMPYNADDATVGMVTFENGETVSMTVTFAMNLLDWDGEVDRFSGNGHLELKVYGETGGIDVFRRRIADGKGRKVTARDLKVSKRWKYPNHAMAAMHYEFASAILQQREPMNSASQAVMLMKMLDALRKSAETGKSVKVL